MNLHHPALPGADDINEMAYSNLGTMTGAANKGKHRTDRHQLQ